MNANAKNLPEFKALIDRYETITLEEIEEAWDDDGEANGDYDVREVLTGFGLSLTCTLCTAARDNDGSVDCDNCVYGKAAFGLSCTFHQTYKNIRDAKTPKALLSAYRARAKYMRTLLKEIDHA